jgi:hypothetical protein
MKRIFLSFFVLFETWMETFATDLGSIAAFPNTVESEGWQMEPNYFSKSPKNLGKFATCKCVYHIPC